MLLTPRKSRESITNKKHYHILFENRIYSLLFNHNGNNLAEYSYDADGRKTSMTDASGTTTYFYTNNRLSSVTDGANNTVSYEYDNLGNQTKITYPGNKEVHMEYLPNGDLYWVSDFNTINSYGEGGIWYSYDSDSNLSSISSGGYSQGIKRDLSGKITRIETCKYGTINNNTCDGSIIDYTNNANNQITSMNDNINPTKNYAYDPMNRLKNDSLNNDYAHDAAGNITSLSNNTSFTRNTNNILENIKDSNNNIISSFTYNTRGARTTTTGTNASTMTYDVENHLKTHETPTHKETYTYNADGLRTSVAREHTNNDNTITYSTETFTWNENAELPQLIQDNEYYYIYGISSTPIAQVNKTTGNMDTLFRDASNNIRTIAKHDGTSANYDYDSYGNPTVINNETKFGFAGEYTDKNTGLQYLRARYYDPKTSEFITPDPVEDDTLTPYAYVDNDPINNNDPSGLFGIGKLGKIFTKKNLKSAWKSVDWKMVGSVALGVTGAVLTTACVVATAGICGGVIGMIAVTAAIGATTAAAQYYVETDKNCRKVKDALGVAAFGAITNIGGFSKGKNVIKAGQVAKELSETTVKKSKVNPPYHIQKCFVAGTMILTIDGAKTIESIKIGDLVKAYDVKTNETTIQRVVSLYQNKKETYQVFNDKNESVTTTASHRFFVKGKGFVEAQSLQNGDEFLSPDGNTYTRVSSVKPTGKTEVVYNFEVEGLHNYFVMMQQANAPPTDLWHNDTSRWILVHNDCGKRKIGLNGTPHISQEVGRGRKWRVDTENPNPANGGGNMHIQDYKGGKWKYDFEKEEFIEMPKNLVTRSELKNELLKAIKKGKKYLGEE